MVRLMEDRSETLKTYCNGKSFDFAILLFEKFLLYHTLIFHKKPRDPLALYGRDSSDDSSKNDSYKKRCIFHYATPIHTPRKTGCVRRNVE